MSVKNSDPPSLGTPDEILFHPNKFTVGWPAREGKEPAELSGRSLEAVLTDTFSTDAHVCAYWTAPWKRLKSVAVGQAPIVMLVFMGDVDCPAAHRDGGEVPEAWRAAEMAKLGPLLERGAVIYWTRGGYRIVLRLAVPFSIQNEEDVTTWRALYLRFLLWLMELGIVADPACRDWTRLYRVPHATRDGGNGQPEDRAVLGNPRAVGAWMPPERATSAQLAAAEAVVGAERVAVEKARAARGDSEKKGPEPVWAQALRHLPEWREAHPDPERDQRRAPRPTPGTSAAPSGVLPAYFLKALEDEADKVRDAPVGGRNQQLNASAFKLGQLVQGEGLDPCYIWQALSPAAEDAGLDSAEIETAIESGLSAGILKPRSAQPRRIPERRPASLEDAPLAAARTVAREPTMAPVVAANKDSADEWEQPAPLAETYGPAFPIDALPRVLRYAALAIADEVQCSPDMVGALSLAFVAAAAQRRFVAQVQPGHREQLSLFVLVAMPPSERKSPAFGKLALPLYEWEKLAREKGGEEITRASAELEVITSEMEAIRKELKRPPSRKKAPPEPERKTDLAQRLGELAVKAKIAQAAIPKMPRLTVDDATPEALARVMAQAGESTAALSDEGGVIEHVLGRFSDNPTIGIYLKGFMGEPVFIDRAAADKPPIHLQHPRLTIASAIQPKRIAEIRGAAHLEGRGFLERCAVLLPRPSGPRDYHLRQHAPDDVMGDYHNALTRLLGEPGAIPGHEPQVIALDDEAVRCWRDFGNANEKAKRALGLGDTAIGWLGKAPGLVARIGTLLHLVEEGPDTRVKAEDIERAIAIVRVFDAHTRLAFDGGVGGAVGDAEQLLRWLQAQPPEPTKRRDAQRRFQGWGGDRLDKAISRLAEAEIVRVGTMRPKTGRPSGVLELNPLSRSLGAPP